MPTARERAAIIQNFSTIFSVCSSLAIPMVGLWKSYNDKLAYNLVCVHGAVYEKCTKMNVQLL